MTGVRPPTSRLLRFLRHPATLLFVTAWLLIDYALLPHNAGAKRWLRRLEYRSGIQRTPQPSDVIKAAFVVYRENGTMRVDLERSGPLPMDTIGFIYVNGPDETGGWWAPTTKRIGAPIGFDPRATLASNPEVRSLLADSIERLPNDHAAETANWIRGNGRWEYRPVLSGYVRDGVAALMALALALGLTLHAIDGAKALAARRRQRRGMCPRCLYDLRGDLSQGCPECGWRRAGA